MKILIVNTFYYPNMVGGTEQSIKLLAEGLSSIGHEVYVLTGDSSKSSKEIDIINNINIIRLNIKERFNYGFKKVVRKGLEIRNILFRNKINEILDEIRPDIIHTNNLFYISPVIWKIAHEKNIKVIHTLRDYWGICPKCTLLNKNCEICSKGKLLCKLHKKNYKLYSKYVNLVTAPSKFTLDLYNENGLFNDIPNKLIYNAIDIDLNEHKNLVQQKLKRENLNIKFVFLGSLEVHKGVKFLIETFLQIKNNNIELIICGDGSLRNYVQEACNKDNRIKYKGKVDKKEKIKILEDSDVMIVPSIWYEPFGRVIIEAYKYAMPVIACKIGGIKELLNDQVSIGITVNCKKELEVSLNRLSNRIEIKKYLPSIKKYIENYDLEEQIKSFNNVYENLVR